MKTAESSPEVLLKDEKKVENTVGKGEIAHYEQFLHFPQCFQKACFPGASKGVIVREWVKDPKEEAFRKHCGNKEKMLVTSIFYFSPLVFLMSMNDF